GMHATGGSVWLLQKSSVGQVGHDVADGGGAEALAIAARQRARAHRLSGGDVCLHDCREDLTFPPSNAFRYTHEYFVKPNSIVYNYLSEKSNYTVPHSF